MLLHETNNIFWLEMLKKDALIKVAYITCYPDFTAHHHLLISYCSVIFGEKERIL
ncbi:MAG: hypothetical protein RIQ74_911 [Pseudomonadota bacterium]|jgi:hypothetical protein